MIFIIARKLMRGLDFLLAVFIAIFFLMLLAIRRVFGKIEVPTPKDRILSLTKDGIYRILECNGKDYFAWDFTRPHAEKTYILYIGHEKPHIFKLGKKVIGINSLMPFDNMRRYLPFTFTVIQQFYALVMTVRVIKKISAKAVEVMFPTKIALRVLLLKCMLSIKVVTQIRGNIDLIYYFNPFPTFWPFKMSLQPFETFQAMWDRLVIFLFYRACDRVIGYNINNMLSAVSSGAHPAKTRLSRIKIELSMLSEPEMTRASLPELPQNGKIISVWSRLSPEKLVLESIQAFEKLVTLTQDDLHFVVIGDGPEYQTILSYVNASVMKDRIYLLGHKDRSYIARVAHHSSLAVIPYGGSSLVEAIMLDVPVVAFDIEWHNELIRNGETGYLADFPDIEHLAKQMLNAISNVDNSRKMARKAKILAREMFNVQKIDENEARYYKPLFE